MTNAAGPLPWMVVDGIEVGNAARTYEYLRNGLLVPASGILQLGDTYPCDVLYNEVGGGPTFVDPIADPAPWYHPDFPESFDFLGLIIANIEGIEGVVARTVTPRLGGIEGAALGPSHEGVRELIVTGSLVARSTSGLDYGFRWLSDVLSPANCDLCQVFPCIVRNACPPGSDTALGRYLIYDVGLTAGPHWVDEAINVADYGCDLRDVTFTVTAENPYLYRHPAACLGPEFVGEDINCGDPEAPDVCTWLFGPPGAQHCCMVSPPSIGTLGTIITIDSPDGVGGLTIGTYKNCPPSGSDLPILELQVEDVPAGGVFVIDSAQRKCTLTTTDPTTGDPVTVDGIPYLVLPPGTSLEWIEVAKCDGATCVCVQTTAPCSGGAATTVLVETQLRLK